MGHPIAQLAAAPPAMIPAVPDLDSLMHEVRDRVASVVEQCVDALDAGIEIQRVHGYYMRRVDDVLAEAETQAILAGEPVNHAALQAIERCVADLVDLRAELAAEIRQAADGDGDD